MRSCITLWMVLITIFLTSTAYASNDYPTPTTTLEALQLESRMFWSKQEHIRFGNSLLGSAAGTTGLVVGSLNLLDATDETVKSQYQGAAGAFFLTGAAFALSAPILELAGENTVANHRLHLGLTSGMWICAGAAFIFRSLDAPKLGTPYSRTHAWRESSADEALAGAYLGVYGLLSLSHALFDWVGKWRFMSLGKRLEAADQLSAQEQAILVAESLEALEAMRFRKKVIRWSFGGAITAAGGTLLAYDFAAKKENRNILRIVWGSSFVGFGAWMVASGFKDIDLFPMLKSKNINFTLSAAPYTGEPMFALVGQF